MFVSSLPETELIFLLSFLGNVTRLDNVTNLEHIRGVTPWSKENKMTRVSMEEGSELVTLYHGPETAQVGERLIYLCSWLQKDLGLTQQGMHSQVQGSGSYVGVVDRGSSIMSPQEAGNTGWKHKQA